ncbi:acetylajmalan esterase-like [Aristolochia californica]|uniref:acetylajmalan esterase-like n=1 Tax=Aristolochia californica TaxID=171875 RepID=UPI0035DECB62
MASQSAATVIIFFALGILSPSFTSASRTGPFVPYRVYDAIYSFGDSIADTGNLIREGLGPFGAINQFPYGETYFGKPTGRCSDGRLIIDFLAERFGLPYINPYLDQNASFINGVNFAVAGATALDPSYLEKTGILMPFTNSSLSVQLNWFEKHLNKSLCSGATQCTEKLSRALFLVGEIGGNDYNYAFFQGKTIEEVAATLVHQVVQSIMEAARNVIQHGARHLFVPGNFPIGCMPSYLTSFGSTNSSDYDERRCLKHFNEFAQLHNDLLQRSLQSLREEFPNVNILYADYYNAALEILDNASTYLGFDESSLLKACCGAGGDYNFNATRMCGSPGTSACSNPSKHLSWDGIHMTEEGYRDMVAFLFVGNLKG